MSNGNGGNGKGLLEWYVAQVNRVTIKLLNVVTEECQNELHDMSNDQQRILLCNAIFQMIKGLSIPEWLLASDHTEQLMHVYDDYADTHSEKILAISDDLHDWKL